MSLETLPLSGLRVLESFAGVLGWTPLGAAFAAPGDAAAGDWGPAILKFLIAAATVGAIWLAWQSLVAKMLVTPGREASAKNYRGLGWFGPTGTWPAHRGRGLGEALLLACLVDVAAAHEICEIAWVGPRAFYERTVGVADVRRFVTMSKELTTT